MALTNIQVKNTIAKDKPYKLPDGDGLILLVKPMGGKYWQFRYRFLGKEQLISFGTYPEITLQEAREKRGDARRHIRNGQNPSSVRQEEKRQNRLSASNTFETVALEWLAQQENGWGTTHASKIRKRLVKHVFPVFGDKPINSIGPLALLEFFKRIEEGGSTEIPHRLQNYCSRIFRYAVLTERCRDNPCFNLKGTLKSHKITNYPRIPIKELPEFLANLEQVSTSEQNKLALKFLMLTLVRQGEMRQAKWDDIDWEAKEWRLPAQSTKMKVEHVVPLSTQALEVLKQLRDLTGQNHHGLLFPSQNRQKNPGMSENTLSMVINKMGYKDQMVPHGCRGVASTHLNETNKFPTDAIERQLAHKPKNAVRAAYNHAEYMHIRRPMMQYWGDYMEQAARSSSKVIRYNFNNSAA